MQLIRNTLSRFPRLNRFAKSIYCFLRGEPPINYSQITKELIQACVNKSDPIILEIGCNSGGHTQWFLKMFETQKYFALNLIQGP